MTETKAKSGATGAPTTQSEPEGAEAGASDAAGRAAVGRATVPGESPAPKFTRPPGMTPPPDRPEDAEPAPDSGGTSTSGGDGKSTAGAAAPAKAAPAKAAPGKTAPAKAAPGAGGSRPAGPATRSGTTAGTKAKQPPGRQAPESADATIRLTPGAATTKQAARPAGGSAAVGAAKVSEAVRTSRSSASGAAARGPRRARLNLKRIDPWSVMKFSLAVSVVLFIVVIVATAVLYLALDAMGVFESINNTLTDLVSSAGGGAGDFKITAKGVIGTAAVTGLVNIVLVTALATLGAFIYNVCADLVGGIELTLAERD